ncbi:hypothetical protein KCU67_g14373, partial [Aureobasidium melanogenum]
TAAGIPTWSPTVVLICRSTAYVWQSGRDAQFSADYGRTWQIVNIQCIYIRDDPPSTTINHGVNPTDFFAPLNNLVKNSTGRAM